MQTVVLQIKDDASVVETALKKAAKQFADGKTKPISFRITQLKNLKKGLVTLNNDLVESVRKDLGREQFATWFSEISLLNTEIDHAVDNLYKWSKGVSVSTPVYLGPACSKVVYEPLGVVGIIGSWNFPIYTCLSPLISAIAAGNTAVIKPSEIAPNTLLKIKSLLTRSMDMMCFPCIEG